MFGTLYAKVYGNVWRVVNAVKCNNLFKIEYPQDKETQKKIAADFKALLGGEIGKMRIQYILYW